VIANDISLRKAVVSDVDSFFAYSLEPEAVRVAMPARDIPNARKFHEEWNRIRHGHGFTCRTILVGSEVAGYIAKFDQMDKPSLSYWLGRKYWGRGTATRALELFLDEVSIRPLYARVATGNGASLRILERQGFRAIGFDQYYSPPNECNTTEVILRLD
jgi:RimJ/RimL family protein N-acetyltransferase